MKEATLAGNLIPPEVNKRAVNNRSPIQTTSQEIEQTPAKEKSPPKKKKPPCKPSTLKSGDLFDATAAGGSREVSMLLSKLAAAVSERAEADTAQMKELEGILTEARNLETFLKEKKKHLKQTLALISDKLLG
uniref:Uncharacterized protein n=1 Tax=Seriola dumerili TaxID=41447 RepID=A0A3B4V6Y0_SERDU